MELSSPIKPGRIAMGVVAGLALVTLLFYGWVQYRQSEYGKRERSVVGRYHQTYTLCITAGTPQQVCVDRIGNACVHDPFWSVNKPFAAVLSEETPDPVSRCRDGVVAG